MNICKHNEFCGGCIYQGIDYDEQLKIKEKEVLDFLEENGVSPEEIAPIEGCTDIYGYRNKMEYTFGDMVKGGELTLGMHKKGHFMSIVTVDDCQLVSNDFNQILSYTLQFVKEKSYKHYHKKTHEGLLRNLIVRRGVRTDELLINIVTTSDYDIDSTQNLESTESGRFDESGYVEGLLQLASDGKIKNKLVGIIRTFNDNVADAVNPEEIKILYGRDYYMEEIFGLKFKVSAFSFFQTNVEAVERLYKEAVDLIDNLSGKTVYDLYCGTGTISQILASKAKSVVGVELVEEAVQSAKENVRLNEIKNCSFIAGDVFKVLDEAILVENSKIDKPDVIVVDPPRAGIQPKALDKIISYGVEQIVYISCNPKTLAPNLRHLEDCGYRCRYLKPFDNFPMTKHVESVVLMSRVK